MLLRIIQRCTFLYVVVLTLLLELPNPQRFLFHLDTLEPTEGYKHLIAFTLLGFLVELSRRKRSVFFWVGILALYAVGTEILQGLLNPIFHRTFDFLDIMQDIFGILLGTGIGYYCRPLIYRFLKLSSQTAIVLMTACLSSAAVLEVSDGKLFQRIEDAVAQAKSGDEIVVHPKNDGTPYQRPVLLIRTAALTIRTAQGNKPVVLDGDGFTYSGIGSVPRAIVQFEPGADGCTLEGFTLINARNASHNGAGVRINQANDVTIRNCIIRQNDMGIMSNGEVAKQTGARQVIEKCMITENGTDKDPGYNHNLYLGGTSVTVRNCEISKSTTGHNIKSRSHLNYIIGNRIYHSANRECDLVDAAGNTDVPGSDSFLLNNVIEKDPKCPGNKAVIHFGRDGNAAHHGTIWLIGNTIRTPFISSVVEVSSGNGAVFIDNTIDDTGAKQKGVLANLQDGKMTVSGKNNTIPERFVVRFPQGEQSPIVLPNVDNVPPLPL